MTSNETNENPAKRAYRPRHGDRRCSRRLQPPPYRTAEGTVETDRRSHLDRRSAWIRDFLFNTEPGENH